MCKLIINGGNRLYGEVKIQGSKNAALPILAASIMTDDRCIIHNCPKISDVFSAFEIIEDLGGSAKFDGEFAIVCGADAFGRKIPEKLMKRMRSSLTFLGSVLAKNGEAVICNPGGCKLGRRPIDIHISALSKLGVEFSEDGNCTYCRMGKLRSETVTLLYPSVGATENIMMICAGNNVEVSIVNAAREPEIVDLQNFLNRMGADIRGAGGDVIRIRPVSKLNGCEYDIMSDRIVTATYMFATAMCGGDVFLRKSEFEHLRVVAALLDEMGCNISRCGGEIRIKSDGSLKGIREMKTLPYPGFPTDVQPFVTAAVSVADGESVICETVFENRFAYAEELLKMGANIEKDERMLRVIGVPKLYGASVDAPDLRGGAALVVAGLAAEGKTEVGRLEYIDRGYECIEDDLRKIGADILRI